jgi:hypothetical protein
VLNLAVLVEHCQDLALAWLHVRPSLLQVSKATNPVDSAHEVHPLGSTTSVGGWTERDGWGPRFLATLEVNERPKSSTAVELARNELVLAPAKRHGAMNLCEMRTRPSFDQFVDLPVVEVPRVGAGAHVPERCLVVIVRNAHAGKRERNREE